VPLFTPSNELLATETHILLGILAIFLALHYGFAWYWGAILILAFAAIKETVIDVYLEGDSFLPPGTGWIDFLGYVGGVILALLILSVTFHL